ncbi:dinuclear metal center protein, YbgI/SA1388 family [Tindallia magadiensis]|uniref:GTP cyclohydrolase 1 type 2 homolog n=1 Tax=Tindallia magadiensis TaxID=69895 RepID=A0A1I3FVN5_9FIRM|nr:Nif3-like dinuclear metal center hexameric protein [Tindallia magadiensis]SFI15320.1 dinuclear metal center protein, YbgI/SA1388 family [Tindallia magadiensis]
MATTVREVIDALEGKVSAKLAMKWDKVGLQIGSMNNRVDKAFTTLDITPETLDEAIRRKAQLIITHHPFIFDPLKVIRTDEVKGDMIARIIKHDMNVYAAHTNMDIAKDGLNDWASDLLELQNVKILEETDTELLEKLVVFIPSEHVQKVSDAIMNAGAGHIGEYSHCGYYLEGTGTFMPLEGTNPFIGRTNKIENVEEVRLETILPVSIRNQIIQKMMEAHPYEEVAYDLYPLNNQGEKNGIGRVGNLSSEMSPEAFIEKLKQAFQIPSLRWTPGVSETISRVGILTGSGASAIGSAVAKGCDCLVTGDIKYHDAQYAHEQGIHLFDIGHFESEITFVPSMKKILQNQVEIKGLDIEVLGATTQKKLLITK